MNSTTQPIFRKFGDMYVIRYFSDLFIDFFDNILFHTHVLRTLDILTIYRYFFIYHQNIGDIVDISSIFSSTDFWLFMLYR